MWCRSISLYWLNALELSICLQNCNPQLHVDFKIALWVFWVNTVVHSEQRELCVCCLYLGMLVFYFIQFLTRQIAFFGWNRKERTDRTICYNVPTPVWNAVLHYHTSGDWIAYSNLVLTPAIAAAVSTYKQGKNTAYRTRDCTSTTESNVTSEEVKFPVVSVRYDSVALCLSFT